MVDEPDNLKYPMPLPLGALQLGSRAARNATGKYDVEVGRIRQSIVFGDKA